MTKLASLVLDKIDRVYRQKVGREERPNSTLALPRYNPSEQCTVLRCQTYTNVFVSHSPVPPADFTFLILVEVIVGIPLGDSLQGILGHNQAVIEFERRNNLIYATIPRGLIDLDETGVTSVALTLVTVTKEGVTPVYLQLTHQYAEVLHSVPCVFVNVGCSSSGSTYLRGPLAETILENLAEDLDECDGSLTSYCTPVEVESLAGWTLLRLLEEKVSLGVTQPAPAEVSERLYVPDDIKRLYKMQRTNRPTTPVNYREFRQAMLHVKRKAEGVVGRRDSEEYFVNSSALSSFMDVHRGVIPLALKTALYFDTRSAADRKVIETYHRKVYEFAPMNTRSVNFFCKHRPSDSKVTVFSMVLRRDANRPQSIPTLERFEVDPARMAEQRYWTFVDDVQPSKSPSCNSFKADTKIFPLPPSFQQNDLASLRERMSAQACEVAPGVYLYVEEWPENLHSSSSVEEKLRHLTISVAGHHFHSTTGVGQEALRFLFEEWLGWVKPRVESALYQSVLNRNKKI